MLQKNNRILEFRRFVKVVKVNAWSDIFFNPRKISSSRVHYYLLQHQINNVSKIDLIYVKISINSQINLPITFQVVKIYISSDNVNIYQYS